MSAPRVSAIESVVREIAVENEDDAETLADVESLNTFVQVLADGAKDAFSGLPAGAHVVAYFITDDYDAGFIFGLRPAEHRPMVNVTSFFTEARQIRGEGDGPLEVAERVAVELSELVPAYRKVWGDVVAIGR